MKNSVAMKRLALTALVGGLALVSTTAFARDFLFPGSVCQPTIGFTTCIDYTQFGAQNNCTTPVTIECPLVVTSSSSANPTVTFVSFTAYDRSTTTDVSCTLQKSDTNGVVSYSDTKVTSPGGPGSGAQLKSFFPSNVLAADGFWRLRCTLPAVQSGNFSHVASIIMQTTTE